MKHLLTGVIAIAIALTTAFAADAQQTANPIAFLERTASVVILTDAVEVAPFGTEPGYSCFPGGLAVEIGEVSYADQGRARVAGRNQGLVRLYARRQGCQLQGAEMLGPRVEHLSHLLAWSVQQQLTVPQMLRLPIYHPVFEEGLRTGLRDLAAKLRITGDCRAEDMANAPGV